MNVPNVNFFINYVDCLSGKFEDKEFMELNKEARDFYGSKNTFDYVGYVNKGSKEKIDFVAYSGNNEKSHGVFNQNGLLNDEQIKELRTKLRQTKSVIWHGLVSFEESFGNTYCDTSEKAIELMKYEFPKFLKDARLIPSNIIWFAGLHENTDNKHIHFSFFEKAPLRYKQNQDNRVYSDGHIRVEAIRNAKVSIELKLLTISKDLKASRNNLIKEFKVFKNQEIGAFMKKIKELLLIIPISGRLSYDSENISKYKPKVDNIINALLMSNTKLSQQVNDFDTILTKRDNEIKNIYKKMKLDFSDKLMKDKYMKDLYRRLGNIVLKVVRDIRIQQEKLDFETKNYKIKKRIERAKRKALFKNCARLNELVTKEAVITFQQFLHKLDEMDYKRQQEEGVID